MTDLQRWEALGPYMIFHVSGLPRHVLDNFRDQDMPRFIDGTSKICISFLLARHSMEHMLVGAAYSASQ